MQSEKEQILELQKELAYYKKQVDRLSGNTISNQYAFAQLSNVCKKHINGFHIIADVQRSFSFYVQKELVYEQFLEGIFSQMFLDRVMLLEIKGSAKTLQPMFWKGFDAGEILMLRKTELSVPEFFLQKQTIIYLDSKTSPTQFEKLVQERLLTPFFILVPLVKNQQVWGGLLVGMCSEIKPMSYIQLSTSNIDMFESLAAMISAMTQQLEQREVMEKERNRIARDMHDDIGSELSKISITCEHLKDQFKSKADVIKDLDIIKESTGSIVNNIGNIIWALNPINNTLDGLLGYLREYTFDYLEMHKLAVNFDIPDTPENNLITHEARSHIFMVVKEALHNIVKHARATMVTVHVSLASNKLVCSIGDDGQGFCINENNRLGNGLRNMRQRLVECGGTLTIQSQPGKGTSLLLNVPF